jgi:hypothetical protein
MANATKATKATKAPLLHLYAVTRVVGDYELTGDCYYDRYLSAPVSYTERPYIIMHAGQFGHYIAVDPKTISMDMGVKSGNFDQRNAGVRGLYIKMDAVLDVDGKLRTGKEIIEDLDNLPVASFMTYTERISALKEFFAKCPGSNASQTWQEWPDALKILKASVESRNNGVTE